MKALLLQYIVCLCGISHAGALGPRLEVLDCICSSLSGLISPPHSLFNLVASELHQAQSCVSRERLGRSKWRMAAGSGRLEHDGM